MRITGPERYYLRFTPEQITCVEGPGGLVDFSGLAKSKNPKLYVVSDKDIPIYVGITMQPMRQRLRYGFAAKGSSGYYGYQWRHLLSTTLDVWVQENANETRDLTDVEAVEAEVVFLIRQRLGQWPQYQTEIHFHQSQEIHKNVAHRIASIYRCLQSG